MKNCSFFNKVSIFRGMQHWVQVLVQAKFAVVLALLCQGSWAYSQVRCQEIYPHQWAGEIITQPLRTEHVEKDIEALSHEQVVRLFERSIELIEEGSAGQSLYIGPVIVHNLASFRPDHRALIRNLHEMSYRDAWIEKGAENLLLEAFDSLASRQGVSLEHVQEFYRKDPVVYREMLEGELREVRESGVEVGQTVVEFRDGSRAVSEPFTDYFVHSIFDVPYKLESFLSSLPAKAVAAVHMFHTHPSRSPGSGGALSFHDALFVGQMREIFAGLRPGTEAERIDYHMYSIARSQGEYVIGHYSERGYGFE